MIRQPGARPAVRWAGSQSCRIEGATQPFEAFTVDRNHVEATRWKRREAPQKMMRGQHDAALLGKSNSGRGAAMAAAATRAHFDKNKRAVTLAQNQVDLAAPEPRPGGNPIIALHQRQTCVRQVGQRQCLGIIAHLFRRPTFLDHAVTTFDASLLLQAAASAAGGQHYPSSTLYVVATPIGNLADLSLRAIHVLALVDAVACEDTRHSAPLLRVLGLDKPLLALHRHNEREATASVLQRLAAGERVACVSDAGTPGVSDPGALLVASVQAAGYRTLPIPGASSAVAALSVAGDATGGSFVFIGFLAVRGTDRTGALERLAGEQRSQIVFEAPHRISDLAAALARLCGSRTLTVCRELTKQFETVATLPASALPGWLEADINRSRGEFVLVLHALASETSNAMPTASDATLRTLLAALPLKQAVALTAELTGAARNALYERALEMKSE